MSATDRIADFRSDTVTRPTAAMRAAMAAAEVGDDVLDGDPTVGALEARAARWLGKEGALFVPSGTMANQVALGAWTSPGDEAIVDERAHVLVFEAGAMAHLHGIQALALPSTNGVLDPERVRAAIRPRYVHCPRTRLLCLEQTHMGSGGRVVPLANLRALSALAREHGLSVHLDGARLPNAVVASGIAADAWAACADSVSICLSKGHGAPVGSLVAGDAAFLERARVLRKRLGGWMRQAGILAAAGLLALEDGLARLSEDHALARALASALAGLEGLSASPAEVETNIVNVHVLRRDTDAPALAERLARLGVRVLALEPRVLRFITHRDVGPADVERARAALARVLAEP